MNCEMSNDYMMKYFDGEVNDIEEAQFRQHLKTCTKCGEEFKCLSEVFTSLETTGTVEPPEDFEARVMEKVDAIELARKQKNSRMLILLYNVTTVVAIVLLMVFVADLKQGGIVNAIDHVSGYLSSFSSIAEAVFGVFGDLFHLIAGVVGGMFQVVVSIIKSYYYIIIILLALLLAIQKLFTYVAAQDRREP